MPSHLARWLALAAAVPLALGACSSTSSSSAGAPATTATILTTATTAAGAPTTTAALTGSLNVFAAASLTGAFTAAKAAFATSDPSLSLTFNFAGSNTLVTQIQQGAPADVFASADQKNMDKLVSAGLVETPVTFARNKLEIAVAPGNPKHIARLQDLAGPGLTVVLEAQGVPAGDYTRQVESQVGISITPKSLTPDVKTAITSVTSGEADATVVYVTDVAAAGAKVSGVPIPDNLQPSITYPIAVVKGTHRQAAAEAFVQSAVSGDVQKALIAMGFLAP
ncbi:MAG TPA: molybdate ABC transporter substrate-binding protein [Acidimicrobiales bacterium]|nr:molybdate ABC transporter substrate-binding protein [Acidimicrobiales bacterium]